MPEVSVPEEHVPEERAAEDFVQEELQIRLPGRTLDAHALVRERVAHILSLGNEPSPSPYNAARLPGFLTSCLNPVYLEQMNLQDLSRESSRGRNSRARCHRVSTPNLRRVQPPAVLTLCLCSNPAPLVQPRPQRGAG